MRSDKPSFDDLEPPALGPSRIDGLSDEEWAARNARKERHFRIVCGLAFGALVGLYSTWHWGLMRSRSGLAMSLIVGGSMALFAALFAQRRDDEALGHAAWILFPEWSLVERLPLWAIAIVWAVAISLVFAIAALVLLAYFPAARR